MFFRKPLNGCLLNEKRKRICQLHNKRKEKLKNLMKNKYCDF